MFLFCMYCIVKIFHYVKFIFQHVNFRLIIARDGFTGGGGGGGVGGLHPPQPWLGWCRGCAIFQNKEGKRTNYRQ